MENHEEFYQLGNYRIYPKEKKVKEGQMFGTATRDCFGYFDDKRINYETTALYFIGNSFFFKEYFHLIGDDDIRILDSDLDQGSDILYQMGDSIFFSGTNLATIGFDISEYEVLNKWLYKDKEGELYFLTMESRSFFQKVNAKDLSFDFETFKHLTDRFYTDKNGLYWFGSYNYIVEEDGYTGGRSGSTKQLEKSNGKNIIPIVKDKYIIYDKNIYACNDFEINKLDLNPQMLEEYILNGYMGNSVLTDGTNSYEYYPYNDRFKKIDEYANISSWRQLTGNISFIIDEKNSSLHYPSSEMRFKGILNSRPLVNTKNGFLLLGDLDNTPAKEYDKVFIRNYTTKQYEELDTRNYRWLGNGWYVYKGVLYGRDCMPIKERGQINVEKLNPIVHKGISTNYYTDGEILLYKGNDAYTPLTDEIDPQISLAEKITNLVDLVSIQIINKDILVDKNYIYIGNTETIEIIPREILGFEVKIYTEEK